MKHTCGMKLQQNMHRSKAHLPGAFQEDTFKCFNCLFSKWDRDDIHSVCSYQIMMYLSINIPYFCYFSELFYSTTLPSMVLKHGWWRPWPYQLPMICLNPPKVLSHQSIYYCLTKHWLEGWTKLSESKYTITQW